jgi:hypothetical protein
VLVVASQDVQASADEPEDAAVFIVKHRVALALEAGLEENGF